MDTLYSGKYLELVDDNGWEWVRRNNCRTVVVILPLLDGDKTVFVEQFRKPVGKSLIEFPAGLVGDGSDFDENVKLAAARELEEETGYYPEKLTFMIEGPASAGLSNENLEIFLAEDLKKTGEGGGVEGENITVHVVELANVEDWLRKQQEAGKVIDLKVWGGLYFINKAAGK
ncbi:MAG: NUDIX hydrolase [Lentisphaeraceae bacterium]|nr:NUDIX hydrolase [Lentisphaeraceae bacterium]